MSDDPIARELAALLAETEALRESVAGEGADLLRGWGAAAREAGGRAEISPPISRCAGATSRRCNPGSPASACRRSAAARPRR